MCLFRAWELILCIVVLNFRCGLSVILDGSNAVAIATPNSTWATVDSIQTKLVSINVESNYTEDFDRNIIFEEDAPKCKHHPSWIVAQNEIIIRNRGAENITISRMSNSEFPPKIFYHFCKLERFELTHQHLNHVEAEYFENAHNLRFLNLSHNDIERIGRLPFGNQSNWIHMNIDLSFNQIEFIEDGAFQYYDLHSLYLDHNKLTTVKWYQFHQVTLHELTLNDNKIMYIDYGIGQNIFYIWNVDISYNPLENNMDFRFKSGITNLQNTGIQKAFIYPLSYRINAQYNQVSEIVLLSDDFDLNQLASLNLSRNLLTSISNISELTNLKDLDLSFNKLEILDKNAFLELKLLERVSLGHNRIKNLYFFHFKTNYLEYLDISYNNLGLFQLNVTFPKLKDLHIEGNNLTTINRDIKRMAPNLVRIGLNDNNWDCGFLSNTFILIQLDGIELVGHEARERVCPSGQVTVIASTTIS